MQIVARSNELTHLSIIMITTINSAGTQTDNVTFLCVYFACLKIQRSCSVITTAITLVYFFSMVFFQCFLFGFVYRP